MNDSPEGVLNLIRISDTFFPLGSFTVSQGMEQLVAEQIWQKDDLPEILQMLLEKVWESFDLQMFSLALEAARNEDMEMIVCLDNLCYASKICEESRTAMMKMGRNLAEVVQFPDPSFGSAFRTLVLDEKSHGMYPVVLAVVSTTMNLGSMGGLSLLYVNLMEVVASLVRMAEIDYLEAQQKMGEIIKDIKPGISGISDIHQSYPIIDIASMRHETSRSRMFIS